MDIKTLEKYLENITLAKHVVYPQFDFSCGISFLSVNIKAQESASFFVGTLSGWRNILKLKAVKDNATYLICNDEAESGETGFKGFNANMFLLNTSLEVLLHRIDRGIEIGFAKKRLSPDETCREFMNDLKGGYAADHELALDRFKSLYYPVEPHIGCIIIQSETDIQNMELRDRVELAISTFFPGTNFFYYEKEWVVFFTQKKETTEKLDFSYDDFSHMLKVNSLYAVIGYPCQRPELLYTIYKTSAMALNVARRMSFRPKVSRVFTYKELNLLFLVHLGSQRFKQRLETNNTMFLAHPDAVKLYYHDIEENDDLLDVLTVYLCAAQNVTEASKLLFRHRNTIHNKINRIKELIGLNMDDGYDCCLLLLSCTILLYQKNCGKMDVTDFL